MDHCRQGTASASVGRAQSPGFVSHDAESCSPESDRLSEGRVSRSGSSESEQHSDHCVPDAASGGEGRALSPGSVSHDVESCLLESDRLSEGRESRSPCVHGDPCMPGAVSGSEGRAQSPGSVSHDAESCLPESDGTRSASSEQHADPCMPGAASGSEGRAQSPGSVSHDAKSCLPESDRLSEGRRSRSAFSESEQHLYNSVDVSGTETEGSSRPFFPYRPDAAICESFRTHGYCHNRACRLRHVEERRKDEIVPMRFCYLGICLGDVCGCNAEDKDSASNRSFKNACLGAESGLPDPEFMCTDPPRPSASFRYRPDGPEAEERRGEAQEQQGEIQEQRDKAQEQRNISRISEGIHRQTEQDENFWFPGRMYAFDLGFTRHQMPRFNLGFRLASSMFPLQGWIEPVPDRFLHRPHKTLEDNMAAAYAYAQERARREQLGLDEQWAEGHDSSTDE